MIVADEAYFEFVRDAEYPDSLEDHDGTRLIITLRTFSKIFGLAGIRVGYGVARPDIITLLNKVRQPFNITSLAQVAVTAGMDDIDHVNAHAAGQSRGDGISRGRISAAGGRTTFRARRILFLPMSATGAGFSTSCCIWESSCGRCMATAFRVIVRISVGLPEENRRLIEALEKILYRLARVCNSAKLLL